MLSNQLRNFCNARSSQLVLEHRAVVARCPGMGHPSRLVAHASSTVEPESAIYSNPELYEAAFSFRQIDDEVKFVSGAYAKHSGGAPLNSVLELGCGPALHSIGLAKEGVRLVIGMDLNQRMLDYAATKVQKETGSDMKADKPKEVKAKGFGVTKEEVPEVTAAGTWQDAIKFVCGDMRSFKLPEAPVDMVMCLLGTFSHMTNNDMAVDCFQASAKALRPGGILLLELAHPGDLFDGTLIVGDGAKEIWEIPQADDKKLLVEWGAEMDNFDPVTQILDRTVTINTMKGDDIVDSVEEVVPYKQYTVQEIDLLARSAGLKVEELYGEMALDVGMTHEDAYRMIIVLSKPNK